MATQAVDVLLIGAGAMSATLGSMLKQLEPSLSILMVERLDQPLQESSHHWNNAGTGHAAYCELNYTPQQTNGNIDITNATHINTRYLMSLEYWSYLIQLNALPQPKHFINPVPHISFVWGDENVNFLFQRYQALSQNPLFSAMEYSEDPNVLAQWIPLVMQGRDPTQRVAATRIAHGTDVNFSAVSQGMINHLNTMQGFELCLGQSVKQLTQTPDGHWHASIQNKTLKRTVNAKFVFIGAGGAALTLLQQSGIIEGKGYGGFPVSGQFLVCKNPEMVKQHHAKVYGKAAIGSPPMSIPHLDTRIIDGQKALLFGPFAGFTTQFLKQGSIWDLFLSIKPHNLWPMIRVGAANLDLIRYLIKQSIQTPEKRMQALRHYFPQAKTEDWTLLTAGQRVQIIKKCTHKGGIIEFGTELVCANDKTLAALLGASPGASILVPIMLEVIERCFPKQLSSSAWQQKIRLMIPSYGLSSQIQGDELMAIHNQVLSTLQLKK